MTFLGHFSAHFPQPVHLLWSMCAILFSTVIAPASHCLAQRPHPIHPVSQTAITLGPLSLLEHDTAYFASYGTSSISPFGHSSIHLPQATHFSLLTTAMSTIMQRQRKILKDWPKY